MKKTPLLLLLLALCAPAVAAPVNDVLVNDLDDFGQVITPDSEAVAPPAKKPKVDVPPAPVKPKKSAVTKQPDCSAEKKRLADCASDYLKKNHSAKDANKTDLQQLIVGQACPNTVKAFLGCAGDNFAAAEAGTAAIQAAIAQYQQSLPAVVKTEPKPEVKVVKKSEDRLPQTAEAEPKVIAPPKSMQQKFPQTIWVFSGPDQEEEARLAKKAERPTILPPKIEKTPDGSQPVKVAVAPEAPKPEVKAEIAPQEEAKPEVKAEIKAEPKVEAKVEPKAEANEEAKVEEKPKQATGPKVVKVEVVKADPAKSGIVKEFVPQKPAKVEPVIVAPKPNVFPPVKVVVKPEPKDESRFPLTTPNKVARLDGKGGQGEVPAVEMPPAAGGEAQLDEENQDEIVQSPNPEDDQVFQSTGDKKDSVREARLPPGAAPKIIAPKPQTTPPAEVPEMEEHEEAEANADDTAPLVESAPADMGNYLLGNRIPKFIRVNVQGYNVRKTPEFEAGRKDNIDFQTVNGSLFAVTRVIPGEEGLATGIFVDGEERWVFMPWNRRTDFQFCESEACFADVKMGLDAIASAGRIDPNDLLACDIIERQNPEIPAEIRPLPKRIVESEYRPTPRTKEELLDLDKRVNRAPSVREEYGQSGCVVDTRSRPKPNFRAFRSTAEARRAFIAYMTPFALEVQEATGLPAAVIIGQAALESGWGTSGLFNNTKNIFGHSCWRYGGRKTLELPMFGHTQRITGECRTPRPAYAGGYYLTFDTPQDSVYAYAANLISPKERNYYPQVRAAVASARPRTADWRQVVDGLKAYDGPNPAYRSLVRDIIEKNSLYRLENKKLCR